MEWREVRGEMLTQAARAGEKGSYLHCVLEERERVWFKGCGLGVVGMGMVKVLVIEACCGYACIKVPKRLVVGSRLK